MKMFTIIMTVIWIFVLGCWIGNLVKLINCDFEAPYKGEIVHAIGLLPIASVITVWIDDK